MMRIARRARIGAVVLPCTIALLQFGTPGAALGLFAVLMAFQVLVAQFIEPRFAGRELNLSPLVVILSLVFWGWVWGPLGMLLSVPLTMILKIAMENSRDLKWVAILLDSPGAALERLAVVADDEADPGD